MNDEGEEDDDEEDDSEKQKGARKHNDIQMSNIPLDRSSRSNSPEKSGQIAEGF